VHGRKGLAEFVQAPIAAGGTNRTAFAALAHAFAAIESGAKGTLLEYSEEVPVGFTIFAGKYQQRGCQTLALSKGLNQRVWYRD
jgi:hypothetical protein